MGREWADTGVWETATFIGLRSATKQSIIMQTRINVQTALDESIRVYHIPMRP